MPAATVQMYIFGLVLRSLAQECSVKGNITIKIKNLKHFQHYWSTLVSLRGNIVHDLLQKMAGPEIKQETFQLFQCAVQIKAKLYHTLLICKP